ncbi:unnamed protein product [Boreogadus saida]
MSLNTSPSPSLPLHRPHPTMHLCTPKQMTISEALVSLVSSNSLLRRNAAIHKLAAILHACLSIPVATVTLRDDAVQRMI